MKIGPVAYDSPFMLAPLAGVSDSPFRRLAREQGASAVYTEMVSADGLTARQQQRDPRLLPRSTRASVRSASRSSAPIPASWPRRRACCASCPAEQRPDLIDINMGCPVRKVVNRCAGAALLTDVPLVERDREPHGRREHACPSPPRSGSAGTASRATSSRCRVALEASGAAAVAIHARTRAEKFEGLAHWEMIGEAEAARWASR